MGYIRRTELAHPNPKTVANLGIDLLRDGFCMDEADHMGVCVQEVPFDQRSGCKIEMYGDFNKNNCTGSQLSACMPAEPHIQYGTLSHSHLLLVLLSFRHEARWAEVFDTDEATPLPEFAKLLHPDGRWDFTAVAEKDPVVRELCANGLYMEVLSWKMIVEEPDACSIISQALNRGHAHALRTSEITALFAVSGAVISQLGTAGVDTVSFEAVKDKIRSELPEFADDVEFVDVFDFVVTMGATSAPFIPLLLEFAKKFVDSKKRQLALQVFGHINKIPNTFPWTKIALMMRAYRQTPKKTWCPLPEPFWKECKEEKLECVEQLMHYFNTTLRPAVAGMVDFERVSILSNVAFKVTDTVCKLRDCKDDQHLKETLCAAVASYHESVVKHCASLSPPVAMAQPDVA